MFCVEWAVLMYAWGVHVGGAERYCDAMSEGGCVDVCVLAIMADEMVVA